RPPPQQPILIATTSYADKASKLKSAETGFDLHLSKPVDLGQSAKGPCRVVFIPKRRKKRIFGILRRQLGEIFIELAQHKESQVVEGHLRPDHVHMCISIPPKYAVSNVVGYVKGKSAITIARKFGGRERNFTAEVFWARGYFVSTVGLDEEIVRAYIRNQEHEDERLDQMKLGV